MEDIFRSLTLPGWIVLFFILTMLLGGVAAVIFAIMTVRKHKKNLKKCPFCAEMIQSAAVVCRFCGRDLP